MRRCHAHEITLLAFVRDAETGGRCITDIVETSFKNASFFTRRWMRDPEIIAIGTQTPGFAGYRNHDINR